jgi:hypothetical protein
MRKNPKNSSFDGTNKKGKRETNPKAEVKNIKQSFAVVRSKRKRNGDAYRNGHTVTVEGIRKKASIFLFKKYENEIVGTNFFKYVNVV